MFPANPKGFQLLTATHQISKPHDSSSSLTFIKSRVQISAQRLVTMAEILNAYPQSLQGNNFNLAMILPH